jgi:opacity protein-like surface antigen
MLRASSFGAGALVVSTAVFASSGASRVQAFELPKLEGAYGAHVGVAKSRMAGDESAVFGAHVNVSVVSWLEAQASIDYRTEESIPIATTNRATEVLVRTIPVTASALIRLPGAGRVQPFAIAGIGGYRTIYDYSEPLEASGASDNARWAFGWHAGAGASMPVGNTASVFAEARYVFLDPESGFAPSVREHLGGTRIGAAQVTGGVSLQF